MPGTQLIPSDKDCGSDHVPPETHRENLLLSMQFQSPTLQEPVAGGVPEVPVPIGAEAEVAGVAGADAVGETAIAEVACEAAEVA